MHATDLLAEQHRDVLGLLDLLRDCAGEERASLLARLANLFAQHSLLEETLFYPLIRRSGFSEAADASTLEHEEGQGLLGQLLHLHPADPAIELLLPHLDQKLREHMDKEEGELFPWACARIEHMELLAVGREMLHMAVELQRREASHRTGPSTEPVVQRH